MLLPKLNLIVADEPAAVMYKHMAVKDRINNSPPPHINVKSKSWSVFLLSVSCDVVDLSCHMQIFVRIESLPVGAFKDPLSF